MIQFEYRIVRKKYVDNHGVLKYNYFIAELFYNPDETLEYFTLTPQSPLGESISGLQRDFVDMIQAFSKQILDYDKLVLEVRKTSVIHNPHSITDQFMSDDEKRKADELKHMSEMMGQNVLNNFKTMILNYAEYLKSKRDSNDTNNDS